MMHHAPAYLFILLFVLAVLGFLAAVFALIRALGEHDNVPSVEQENRDERNAILRALRDIKYEFQVGKMDADAYQRLETAYRERARELMQHDVHREQAEAMLAKVEAEVG